MIETKSPTNIPRLTCRRLEVVIYQYLMQVRYFIWWQVAELSYDSFMNRLKAR